ncbi:MAG: FAD binding domain-containing protein [Dehalobacterium sp.]
MLIHDFNYLKPHSLEEAFALMEQYDHDLKFLAGGTDLLVQMGHKNIKPANVMDIKALDLSYCRMEKGLLQIGAATTLSELLLKPMIRQNFIPLWEAVKVMASVQVRNRATIGGNLCNGAPSADCAPPLSILKAQLVISSKNKKRIIPLDEFFVGPGQTILERGELLMEIHIPEIPQYSAGAYCKHMRSVQDISLVGVGAWIKMDQDGRCSDIRVCLGAVGPTILRAIRSEQFMLGKEVNEQYIKEAADLAIKDAKPRDDIRASVVYRNRIVKVLAAKALRTAWLRAIQ